jgi:hypothetical protein
MPEHSQGPIEPCKDGSWTKLAEPTRIGIVPKDRLDGIGGRQARPLPPGATAKAQKISSIASRRLMCR